MNRVAETILAAVLTFAALVGVLALMYANAAQKRYRYGLPRCRHCRRMLDEHTNINACPDGSGRLYAD